MDSIYTLQIIAWVWIVVGAVLFIRYLVIGVAQQWRHATGSWGDVTHVLGSFSGSTLLSIGISAAGSPSIALPAWRITGMIVAIFAIYIATRIQNIPGPPGTQMPWQATVSRLVALIAAIPVIAVNWLSFQMKSVPSLVESMTIASEPFSTAATGGRSFTALWAATWLGTLLLLAAGAVVFLVLFVRRVGRGGAPKLETHWEGIGGGVGGWRMSSSLGYLLVAAVLSLFFTLFLFRFDFRQRELDLANSVRPTPTPTATPAPAAR